MFTRISCVISLLIAICGVTAAQTTAEANDAKEKKVKATIQGRTIHALTKEPVKKASIMLFIVSGGTTPITAESDETGKFEFKDLEAGKYQMFAERQGFARQAYGARTNPLVGSTLTVRAGEEMKDIAFAMIPNAIITGKVTDDTGEPVAGVTVMAMRSMYRRGKKDFLPTGAQQSNDLGEFRIAGLGPGKYLLVGVYRRLGMDLAGASQPGAEKKPQQGPVTTFYPSASDPGSASLVEVAAGNELRGIDIRMNKAAVVKVRGKIAGVPIPLSRQMIASLTPKGFGLLGLTTRQIALIQASDGTFEFKGIPPGSYLLTGSSADMQDASAATPVEVGDQGIEGLVLNFGGSVEVHGTVATEGEAAPFKAGQVMLESIELTNPMPVRGPISEGKTFALKNVSPDKYQVHVIGAPPELFIKSVRFANQEVYETGLDLSSGAAGPVEIKMSSLGSVVEGVVKGLDDKPMTGATVALIPDSRLRTRYKTMTTDQTGMFSFKGVAPGEYKLLAWDQIDPGAHEDPEFVRQFESKAEKVSAKEKGSLSVNLKVVGGQN